ncbi:carcinoembryonic antigen-related cell adhesion molecule 1-like isoform X2 [Spea bombifrons]|uniref:carcinoembryonic antigen-related cell adhesion molecule 1-like isoform X2 n=1 Tax=Spea bombifrons TaxID=233779 RepID=UPI00234A75E4|nr:carcinoembryonic antigen-related cell adhesion molecule 1-like isoform X2 [Spea bombifrons]
MLLTRSLLTWALILSAAGPASSLRNVTGIQGGSVDLSVNLMLPDIQNSAIAWSFNSNVLIVSQFPNGSPIYNTEYKDRCELFVNTTLQLRNLTAADQGEYTLTVQDLTSSTTRTESLRLMVYSMLTPPGFTFLPASDNHPVNGTNATLHCVARGQTVDSYSFHRGKEDACSQAHVTCVGPNLNFHPILQTDEGNYTCTIHNPISNSTSAFLHVGVRVPVSEVMLQSNESVNKLLWVGVDSVSLDCTALGTEVQFSWNLNGTRLPADPRYHFSQNNSTLTISPVQRSEEGTFTCTAKNSVNNMTSNPLNLSIAFHPDDNIKCSASAHNETVQLQCSWEGGVPPAEVRMQFQNINETGQDRVINNVAFNTTQPGEELFCYGSQVGKEVACALKLGAPKAENFKNESTSEVPEGTSVNLIVSLIPSTMGLRSLVPEAQVLPATFTWYRYAPQPSPVTDGEKFKVNSTEYVSTLTVFSATPNENGTYECRAQNLFGTSSFFFVVNVTENPVPPRPPGGLDGGEIAGIVIGVLAGVAIIGIIIYFIIKEKKKKAKAKTSGINPANQQGNTEYAVIHKNTPNGGSAEISVADMPADGTDDVKYAVLKFPNKNSSNPAPTPAAEIEYSTVKPAAKK